MMDNIAFRTASENDTGKILFFIKELAKYEKMSDDVVATEQSLKKWIFDEKAAEVVFALENGKEVGFMLYFYNFSTFLGKAGIYLEDIFILPEYRRKGYGRAMFAKLARIAADRGCGRLEWQCLDWNKSGIGFYTSMGARAMDEWTVYRISGTALEKLANGEIYNKVDK